ncbi:MAG TPA: acetyl-CoA carboxylase carboxyltransferase subunit alpha [Candidatus Limnocylindria bacterium]|nr:acetyl-CoA carboxylase carboxyltransferase subunit alpha [Candidatus Limnocylindria bacterium]
MVERILGKKAPVETNGHLTDPALITDVAAIAETRGTAWQAVQLARDPKRPHAMDVIAGVFEKFQELHGDRLFRDDPAIVGGIAELDGRAVVVVGQQKGSSTEENIARNFGMPHPEGYRKAIRLYRLAEKFHLPLITLIDTPGAFPGPEAEERGQAEAIARSIEAMTRLETPVVAVVLGEGGSGGALALGVGDVVLALENAVYSVISPEGAAAILFRSNAEAQRAANALRLAGPDLLELGIVDGLIAEPPGGAQNDHSATAKAVKAALIGQLDRLSRAPTADLLSARYERFRRIGVVVEPAADQAAPGPEPWWRRITKALP